VGRRWESEGRWGSNKGKEVAGVGDEVGWDGMEKEGWQKKEGGRGEEKGW